MGMETLVIRVEINTCLDDLPVDGKRLTDHLLAAMSKFETEEYRGENHLWEVEKIEFGFDWEFARDIPFVLYDLSEEMEKDRERMLTEGGSNEMVGESRVD